MADLQEMLGSMGEAKEGIDTNVDIVFVIDATRSMQDSIDMVKESALSFDKGLNECLAKAGRIVNNLRIKVIWFRDFYWDGNQAFGESKFFEMPDEKEEFHDFVSGIHEAGGYDEPESALEALVLALRSDFVQDGEKKRHIIVLFTDADAHDFKDYDRLVEEAAKKGCRPEMYPDDMPKDISEFYNAWQGNGMCQECLGNQGETTKFSSRDGRLVLFAPDAWPWTDMSLELENVIHQKIMAGEGGSELDMEEVYNMIAFSM